MKMVVFQWVLPWRKHHRHAGRSVYRQANATEIGRRTYRRRGRRARDKPASAGRNNVCYRLDKDAP
jgi:hypothetical protein